MTSEQLQEKLGQLPGWTQGGGAIRKQFVFDGFPSAVAFVVRVGFDAEAADHHPDVLISNYRKVTLTFTTHSAGGLTEKDLAGAERAEGVFKEARQP
jgi:4a-hydroxytetrahydrobiopterin dehydratase